MELPRETLEKESVFETWKFHIYIHYTSWHVYNCIYIYTKVCIKFSVLSWFLILHVSNKIWNIFKNNYTNGSLTFFKIITGRNYEEHCVTFLSLSTKNSKVF